MAEKVQEKTFRVEVDFVTKEFVEWISRVAEDNCMDRDYFIRYVLRQWLLDNYKCRKILVDTKTHLALETKALREGKTIPKIIEYLITLDKSGKP